MPLSERDLGEVRRRVFQMLVDTIATLEALEKNAELLYGDRAASVRAAINEYLDDFIRNPAAAGQIHPEVLIYRTPQENLQRAGLYGAQLTIKEQQVTRANRSLRERIAGGVRRLFRRPFRKWVDTVNNFLGSLAGATGLGEALKELKDCLRDELP
jgi:hypothetical protein